MFILSYILIETFFIINLIKIGKGQSQPFHFKLKEKKNTTTKHNQINDIENIWIASKNNQSMKDDQLQQQAAIQDLVQNPENKEQGAKKATWYWKA